MPIQTTYENRIALEKTLEMFDIQEIPLGDNFEGCIRINFREKYWCIWLAAKCWVECDKNDLVIGALNYGSVASFYRKEIALRPGIPENHYKRWRAGDQRLLSVLASENATISEAAEMFERTEWFIALKFASLHKIEIDENVRNADLGKLRFKSLMPKNI